MKIFLHGILIYYSYLNKPDFQNIQMAVTRYRSIFRPNYFINICSVLISFLTLCNINSFEEIFFFYGDPFRSVKYPGSGTSGWV